MIRRCCVCKVIYGEKEPFEDKSETHGYCDPCFDKATEERAARRSGNA